MKTAANNNNRVINKPESTCYVHWVQSHHQQENPARDVRRAQHNDRKREREKTTQEKTINSIDQFSFNRCNNFKFIVVVPITVRNNTIIIIIYFARFIIVIKSRLCVFIGFTSATAWTSKFDKFIIIEYICMFVELCSRSESLCRSP